MSLKTENLAIVITDIAGYTEATQNQSRQDNARLLATHNRILYPIIKRYKGRQVKSIGDALLLVFRSPTDAMLCAMAMQDALFEFNRNSTKEQQIHIRVAASLGEVRVTRNDVFGEAVNITSRIEGITPPDEIYMSEAVYMAMNKAEVPSQEVGRRELKGITGTVRIFNIPRFSTPRLVPQDIMAAEDMSDLVYPYGGAHLSTQEGENGFFKRLNIRPSRGLKAAIFIALLLPTALLALQAGKYWRSTSSDGRGTTVAKEEIASLPRYQPEFKVGERPESKVTSTPAQPSYQKEFVTTKSELPVVHRPNTYSKISDAKKAYKDRKISKDEYKKIANDLENSMEQEIKQAKNDYKTEKISKKEYKDRIEAIEKKYK